MLQARGGLPAHVAGRFTSPLAFQQSDDGDYFVFDRREHSVYRVDADAQTVTKVVDVGGEPGRILQPHSFDLAPDGTFVVADAPRQQERVQRFRSDGSRLGGFTVPSRSMPRVVANGLVLSGVGSLDFTGRSVLVNEPGRGGLITIYGLAGTAYRTIGNLRDTGHEHDREVHLGLNTGIPLAVPGGGYYFVFRTGTPMFRKFDREGSMIFERHIEGRELDPVLRSLPTSWPRTQVARQSIPLMAPTIRAAAVDRDGNLWIALARPYTYVYDPDGEKTRTVQFRATDILSPTSLAFSTRGGVLVTPGCYEFY